MTDVNGEASIDSALKHRPRIPILIVLGGRLLCSVIETSVIPLSYPPSPMTEGYSTYAANQPASLVTSIGLGPHPKELVNASLVLATVGQFTLLVLLVKVLLFTKVEERSASLASLLVATFVSSVPPYLLVYGGVTWNPDPPKGLCAIQASLLAGSATMPAVASWLLVFDSLLETRIFFLEDSGAKLCRTFFMAIPSITFVILSVITALLCLIYPNQVKHHPYHIACSLNNTSLNTALQIVGAFTLLTTLCLEAYVLVVILRPRRRQVLPSRRPASSDAVRIIIVTGLQATVLITEVLSKHIESPNLRIVAIFAQAFLPLGTSMTTTTRWMDRLIITPFKRRPGSDTQKTPSPIEAVEIKVTVETNYSMDDMRPVTILLEGLVSSHEKALKQ